LRFYFNLAGAAYDPDNVGEELPNMQAARIHSVIHASEVLRERPELVWSGDEVRIDVTDENRLVLFTVIVVGVNAAAALGHD
jgi:hypothetical protein